MHAEPDEVGCLIDDQQPGQERFLVCTSLLILVQRLCTAKEVTKVTTANSLNGGRGTKYGKLSSRGGHMPLVHLEVQKSTASDGDQGRGLGTWLSKTGMWIYKHSKITYFTGLTSITYLHRDKVLTAYL